MLINRTGFLCEIKDHNPLVIIKLVIECLSLLIGLSDILVRSSYLQSLVLPGVNGVIFM